MKYESGRWNTSHRTAESPCSCWMTKLTPCSFFSFTVLEYGFPCSRWAAQNQCNLCSARGFPVYRTDIQAVHINRKGDLILGLAKRGPGSSHLKCSFVVIVWPFLVTQKQSYQLNWELASAPDCKETDPDQWWSAENDLGPCQEHLGRTTLLKGALLQQDLPHFKGTLTWCVHLQTDWLMMWTGIIFSPNSGDCD